MQKITSRRFAWTLSAIVLFSTGIACKNDSQIETASKPAQPAMTAQPVKPAAPAPAQPATPVAASEITGAWKWSVNAGDSVINHSAKFKQTGQTLGGTWTDSFGDQPVTADIKEGSVKDGQVNFKVTRPSPFGDGSEMTLTFAGKLSAIDKIDGTINVLIPGGEPIPSEWHAIKVKE
ncbi:MAG TPA: hypothetical protein VHD56_10450 [Tepidisphaeraceae bacterium]|nr:hypothetical protein [Tepidisphaeraceae bacterium]